MGNMFNQTQNQTQKRVKMASSVTGPIFYCEDLSVQFGEIRALKNVQLTIEKGEVIKNSFWSRRANFWKNTSS